jgi:hypothetical protein
MSCRLHVCGGRLAQEGPQKVRSGDLLDRERDHEDWE